MLALAMTDLQVRQLDDQVTAALRARAARKGISLEEEVRTTLAASVDARRRAFLRPPSRSKSLCPRPARPRAWPCSNATSDGSRLV